MKTYGKPWTLDSKCNVTLNYLVTDHLKWMLRFVKYQHSIPEAHKTIFLPIVTFTQTDFIEILLPNRFNQTAQVYHLNEV